VCFHLSVAPALSQFSLFVLINMLRRLIDLILILIVISRDCVGVAVRFAPQVRGMSDVRRDTLAKTSAAGTKTHR
jgi:hypothetical protein